MSGMKVINIELSEKPLFSIAICCFNAVGFLPRMFASIKGQNYQNYEAVFYDDGSTDNSTIVAKRLVKELGIGWQRIEERRLST